MDWLGGEKGEEAGEGDDADLMSLAKDFLSFRDRSGGGRFNGGEDELEGCEEG
jgi:hypothetical protein